jgi:hypothetical protein
MVPRSHLYLDTARLGRMTPGAQRAVTDFARLAGDEGASPVLDRFLRAGFEPDDAASRDRYPGLAGWMGVSELKQSLRLLAGHRPDLPVLLAARSAQLMKFAARLLFHPCSNVLVTDLGWPEYHAILEAEARRATRTVTSVPLRDGVLQAGLGEADVVERVRSEFVQHGCDGLFLTSVSNLGARLPVAEIVRAVEATRRLRFVVVDGAQGFCHTLADLRDEFCDLFLAGCHKFLGAYHPMGVGFYGRRRSRWVIETVLAQLLRAGDLDDPLLRFSAELEGDVGRPVSETVGLTSLFACQGAATDAMTGESTLFSRLPDRLHNLSVAAEVAAADGWRPLLPDPALRSGILLLQAERAGTRRSDAQALRSEFHDRGVSLTAYRDGMVRLSMPDRPWALEELALLQQACRSVA